MRRQTRLSVAATRPVTQAKVAPGWGGATTECGVVLRSTPRETTALEARQQRHPLQARAFLSAWSCIPLPGCSSPSCTTTPAFAPKTWSAATLRFKSLHLLPSFADVIASPGRLLATFASHQLALPQNLQPTVCPESRLWPPVPRRGMRRRMLPSIQL